MKCDLCKHYDVRSENNLHCESCAEMIQRLLIVQQRMAFHEPPMAAAASA
jgi:hypothetical protein